MIAKDIALAEIKADANDNSSKERVTKAKTKRELYDAFIKSEIAKKETKSEDKTNASNQEEASQDLNLDVDNVSDEPEPPAKRKRGRPIFRW